MSFRSIPLGFSKFDEHSAFGHDFIAGLQSAFNLYHPAIGHSARYWHFFISVIVYATISECLSLLFGYSLSRDRNNVRYWL